MSNIIINMNVTKEAEAEVAALKPKDATEKADMTVKLDDSTCDSPVKRKEAFNDEASKKAEALSADDKPPVSVKVEASPKTEDALNNTDSDATAEELAKDVAKETDDYVTKGSDTKADDSSSAVKTERESEAPMSKKEARKRVLVKLAAAYVRKQATCSRGKRQATGRGKTALHKQAAIQAALAVARGKPAVSNAR